MVAPARRLVGPECPYCCGRTPHVAGTVGDCRLCGRSFAVSAAHDGLAWYTVMAGVLVGASAAAALFAFVTIGLNVVASVIK